MKELYLLDFYQLFTQNMENISIRKTCAALRKKSINSISKKIVKLAFDTRRTNQETDYNPRRNAQNYNRSAAFVSENLSSKLKSFAKLRNILNGLKTKYGKEHEWQDSYARVLLGTLDRGLRTEQKDGDFAEFQPSSASIDYIEELLQVRYRLGFDDINKYGTKELEKIILAKDENLINKDLNIMLNGEKEIVSQGYDTLMEKLFGNVRASKDNKSIKRTVTITIEDKVQE